MWCCFEGDREAHDDHGCAAGQADQVRFKFPITMSLSSELTFPIFHPFYASYPSLFDFATRHGASTLSEQTLLAMCADPSYLSSNAPTIFGLAVLSKQYKIAYTALCAFTATVVDIQPSPIKSSARGKQSGGATSTHVVVVTEEHMLRDIPREMWERMTREVGDRLNEVQAEVMRMGRTWGQVISPEQLKVSNASSRVASVN